MDRRLGWASDAHASSYVCPFTLGVAGSPPSKCIASECGAYRKVYVYSDLQGSVKPPDGSELIAESGYGGDVKYRKTWSTPAYTCARMEK